MLSFIAKINSQAQSCSCGHHHAQITLDGTIASGAIRLVPGYIGAKGLNTVCVVADRNTDQAAGEELRHLLQKANFQVQQCLLPENKHGDVVADECAVVQLLLSVTNETELLLAVGSGTIHDIVRFVCAKTGKPFLSIPTAASVDGFTSAGAPLMINQVKQTVKAISPLAIFADLDILEQSPRDMTAAGFGDMLGKWTSLADWRFSKAMANEPFCPLAFRLTEESLLMCIQHVDEIASGSKEGLRILMEALIKSGLSMLLVGHSRPASGGEHHLSHMWEMEHLRAGRPQRLHGAKVGVAAVIISSLYRTLAHIERREPFSDYLKLPEPTQLARWLKTVGGPSTPEELGIERKNMVQTLKAAPDLRPRMTGLRYIRDHHPRLLAEVVQDMTTQPQIEVNHGCVAVKKEKEQGGL
ncbi:glycerol-1-phosphate dehydrogenase [NAD(P)+] [Caldalkalibacillus uzonensis]|uniref:Glycerol-1-phosphate dehydrogenase [NAD(P)+] n=1 Tax=Caldalkalibacillus uzonensis TaxID=353224 RepID=A0ABU0CQF1_9BACI|nr:sn-glycerol-1-phosphate dehydrogenase [Caldalkalibacillus uzonensis]MDQ0338633.1 glycerol-1-phosphate dehydrogenase [NAD(P)+] [Caldalkalibacillus uzonensis]